jgi:hypothetical protein
MTPYTTPRSSKPECRANYQFCQAIKTKLDFSASVLFGFASSLAHCILGLPQSDTPREAGGLMSWAASKAVGLLV